MNSMNFDIPIDRNGTSSCKWDKYKGKNIIPLWVADMDFPSPDAVIHALHKRVEHGIFGYTVFPDVLKETIRTKLLEDYGWEINTDWLIALPGLVPGLNIACRATGKPGDSVLTAVPVYPPFLTAPVFSDRKLIKIPLISYNRKWVFDFDKLRESITPDSGLLLLCNPHNPVGRVYTIDELKELTGICEEYDLIICSDEIHNGLVLDDDKSHIPTATLSPSIAERTITLMSPSKTFNTPGLGFSFAIISNPELHGRFLKAMAGMVPDVNALASAAALAAYRDGKEWHRELIRYLKGNRNLVMNEINQIPGLSMTHVEATYLAWIDTRDSGLADPGSFFESAGVGLSNGREFGSPGFVRLNFGCPRSYLIEALGRMKSAMTRM